MAAATSCLEESESWKISLVLNPLHAYERLRVEEVWFMGMGKS